ncbi:hypothetical protein GPA10_16175 [Streptomyces sp. p1417]|uniref:Uncharacterized protein n=1 Tax=Streptomyces typhae TaxID=2681492 RepID=A0A6L6WXM3_9ACTN|nr:hypothetical protein [Streptomyces typhae]MVO86253.1 hypothetical protein [Streptomyces typhae]
METHGTGLPSGFMAHGGWAGWSVPSLIDEEIMEVDDFFMSLRAQG